MSEDLQKEIKEIKKEVNKERITNIKNSSIRNLKINGKRLLTNAPFVIAIAVPLGISKVLLDDIPFIRTNEKRYKETITEINSNEELSYQEQYIQETTFEAKPSLWQRFKNSKIVKAATYIFRIKVKIELPTNALPEGNEKNA